MQIMAVPPRIFLAAFVLLALSTTANAQGSSCPKNPSCNQLENCLRSETFKIDFDIILKCAKQRDLPLKWRPQDGKGAVNLGGVGVAITGRNKPGDIPISITSGSGGGGGGDGGGDGGDGGGVVGNPCEGEGDPTDICNVEGKTETLADKTHQCGASVELGPEIITFYDGYNSVLMNADASHDLKLFSRSGTHDLNYSKTFKIPEFYCVLAPLNPSKRYNKRNYSLQAVKMPFVAKSHYQQIGSNTDSVPISTRSTDMVADNYGLTKGLIVMEWKNGNLSPPKPNPGWFTGNGAYPPSVDGNCYTEEQLFTPPSPRFGDIRIQNDKRDYCSVENFFPLSDKCIGMRQSMDYEAVHLYVPEGKSIKKLGKINSQSPFGNDLVQGQTGNFSIDTTATAVGAGSPPLVTYDGAHILQRGNNPLYISTALRPTYDYTLLGGATLFHPSGRNIVTPPPGRIKVTSGGEVTFIDGATVYNDEGVMLNILAPNAKAAGFEANGVISGNNGGAWLPPQNMPLPVAKNAKARLPFTAAKCSAFKFTPVTSGP